MSNRLHDITGLYLISGTYLSHGRTHEEIALAGIRGGARVIQLREKSLSAHELLPVALRMSPGDGAGEG